MNEGEQGEKGQNGEDEAGEKVTEAAPEESAAEEGATEQTVSEEGAAEPAPGLSARDRAVLALERAGLPGPGAKERAVRERLGMSPTRYYQLLNVLLDDPRAEVHDPVTVHRLRRIREERRAAR